MPEFRVRLFAEAALQLTDQVLELRFEDSRAAVSNWMDELPWAEPTYRGLRYDTYVSDDNILDALDKATLVSQVVTEQLSFVHAAAIEDPRPWLAFDLDRECPDRQIAQVIHDVPRLVVPQRRVRPGGVLALTEGLSRNAAAITPWRVGRAMHHLRRATLEVDDIDRFEDLWDGLELLDSAIRGRFSLESGYMGSPCANCGAERIVAGGSQGIRHAVEEVADSSSIWREVRTARQEVAHGTANVALRVPGLGELCEVLRKALVWALCEVIEVPDDQRTTFVRRPLPLHRHAKFILLARLDKFSVDDLAVQPELPYFEVVDFASAAGRVALPEGGRMEESSIKLRIVNYGGTLSELRIRGQVGSDPEDITAGFSVSGRVNSGEPAE